MTNELTPHIEYHPNGNMWTLRILKEPNSLKYQTIGGFLFRLFGVSR